MLSQAFLSSKWSQALDYAAYLRTGTEEQQRRWSNFHTATSLKASQKDLLASFTRPLNILTISGIWCGDCVEQVPFLDHISRANPKIAHRLIDRDVHKDLSSQLQICAGDRVPVVLFLSEDFDFLALAGDRSLSRYRAKALRELAGAEGASCSTGLVAPIADQNASTLQDWVNEVERVQLMVRLSPRYRKKYGD